MRVSERSVILYWLYKIYYIYIDYWLTNQLFIHQIDSEPLEIRNLGGETAIFPKSAIDSEPFRTHSRITWVSFTREHDRWEYHHSDAHEHFVLFLLWFISHVRSHQNYRYDVDCNSYGSLVWLVQKICGEIPPKIHYIE